jgi:hypothetical protein
MSDDRFQIINDQEEAMRIAFDGFQVGVWTAIPGIITEVDFSAMTCTVQPAIQTIMVNQKGVATSINIPLLLDVPIVFPKGGGFLITLPLAVDDEVLVVFSSRCIDAWWQDAGVQQAMEARMHDLSDGFAIPGPYSIPNIPDGAFDTDRVQVRNEKGTVYIAVGNKFAVVNSAGDLKTVLIALTNAVKGFMDTIAALTPPTTPVLNSVIQVPALAATTALTTVLTDIAALLEAT